MIDGSLTQWIVSDGTIEVIGPTCYDLCPSHGVDLDMDGSSCDAGGISRASFDLVPGARDRLRSLHGKTGDTPERLGISVAPRRTALEIAAGAIRTLIAVEWSFIPGKRPAPIRIAVGGADLAGPVMDSWPWSGWRTPRRSAEWLALSPRRGSARRGGRNRSGCRRSPRA